MFVCGEFAKRGPGIDEKYWASRDRSMLQGGGQRPYQPHVQPPMPPGAGQRPQQPRVRPSSGYKQIERDRGRYDDYRDRVSFPHRVLLEDFFHYRYEFCWFAVKTVIAGILRQERHLLGKTFDLLRCGHSIMVLSIGKLPRPALRVGLQKLQVTTNGLRRHDKLRRSSGSNLSVKISNDELKESMVFCAERRPILVQNDSSASGYAQFRALSSHNSSLQTQSYLFPHKSSTQRRARGERIYRYDTGPMRRTHPDGTVTINRQVIYITENRRPSMTLHQRLPGLIKFTHITPPPPFSTMISPLLRQRLKKLMKEKVPPRTVNPPKISSPIPEQETHFERGSVVREYVTQPSIVPSSARAKDTTHENHSYIRHPTSRESDGRQSTLATTSMTYRNQGSALTTSQYSLRLQPYVKQISAKPLVTDAEHSLRSSPSPTIRIEAERLDISRPVVISVSPKKVDFDEVLAIDSKIYDDYDDTFNDLNFDNTHPEVNLEEYFVCIIVMLTSFKALDIFVLFSFRLQRRRYR
ncbi:unnamed protein product [Angiostrongylus costaricensis]|uniref:SH2 domain-containing protein n=1 Tax=Angiostrongylus costaricensis TaxID=334426 RepID=A0A158PLW3_ANGCS|nr:unnamed protein product [Angiostrongylus costaricensis]